VDRKKNLAAREIGMPRTKLTPEQKERRQHERKAKWLNDREQKAYGPLFAHLAPVYTAEDGYWYWRRQKALAMERSDLDDPTHQMNRLIWQSAKRFAMRALGNEWGPKIIAYIERVYPEDYRLRTLGELVCGKKKIALNYRLAFDPSRIKPMNPDGRYLIEEDVFPPEGWVSPVDPAEFNQRFPLQWYTKENLTEPDDAGLFDRVMSILATS
jgi:hypothetical protein